MWRGYRKHPIEQAETDANRLVAETEAFLSGDLLKEFRRSGKTVPGWAWLNAFAHGDLHRIREMRQTDAADAGAGGAYYEEAWMVADPLEQAWRDAEREARAWRSAQRILAEELLQLVDGDAELLSRFQTRALSPLELRLMESEGSLALSPFDLVQSTRAALRSSMT